MNFEKAAVPEALAVSGSMAEDGMALMTVEARFGRRGRGTIISTPPRAPDSRYAVR
jgi:hypothetical protein